MVVGGMVGKLTRIIVERVTSQSVNTFCISYSLGSHLCGFIGKEYKLTGIIALDPSNMILEPSSDDGRLSKKDAKAVFVIHTNYDMVGVKKPIGHVDMYVNGGGRQKVECGRLSMNDLKSDSSKVPCHHMYAVLGVFAFANQHHCATNVFCPVQSPFTTIKGIKFPEIDVEKKVVKEWSTIEERSSPSHKQVGEA